MSHTNTLPYSLTYMPCSWNVILILKKFPYDTTHLFADVPFYRFRFFFCIRSTESTENGQYHVYISALVPTVLIVIGVVLFCTYRYKYSKYMLAILNIIYSLTKFKMYYGICRYLFSFYSSLIVFHHIFFTTVRIFEIKNKMFSCCEHTITEFNSRAMVRIKNLNHFQM